MMDYVQPNFGVAFYEVPYDGKIQLYFHPFPLLHLQIQLHVLILTFQLLDVHFQLHVGMMQIYQMPFLHTFVLLQVSSKFYLIHFYSTFRQL